MEILSAWLIHHKASFEPDSPMNLDGSTYMVGVAAVPAQDMQQALSRFDEYLADNKMAVIEVTKCEQWGSSNFDDGSFESKLVNKSAGSALEQNKVHYAYGESFESSRDE